MTRPEVLIEQWLPVKELGIESVRERAAASALPPIYFLHVWWARRPLVASAGAILPSLLPAWSEDLAARFPDSSELSSETEYHAWVLRLLGILGDPVMAKARIAAATEAGVRLGAKAYGYKQAYRNHPIPEDVVLLHRVLEDTWGEIPTVADPTAGGGSIPFEAIRYGLPTIANDLNPIAVSVMRAGVELSAKYGRDLVGDLNKWGEALTNRIAVRLSPFFKLPDNSDNNTYLYARTIACPRTGKPVPLAPNWWLTKDKGGQAVRMITIRDGGELDAPEFEIVAKPDFDPSKGTVARGKGVSPWDNLVIDGDYIKAEAKAGRMGSMLYAVATRTDAGRGFRPPTQMDLEAIAAAEKELERLLPEWDAADVLPTEDFPKGNDNRPLNFGMPRWRDMFSPRQLLVHGTFVEEFRKLIPEVRAAIDDPDRADAVLALLALMQGKALNWNAMLSSWNVGNQSMRSVFDRHDFAFKWTWAEFEGATELYAWSLSQLLTAYGGICQLLLPDSGAFVQSSTDLGAVSVGLGNAGNLSNISDGSVGLVAIDPPYYDNVMYAELSDFFYVWEKRTLGRLWPELFETDLTDKTNEAVANPARFASYGRRRKELANTDYENKMTAIFDEAHRVLRDDGVLTVMFTHKRAEAWDTLGTSLLESRFTIETSWPVATERENSLHQAKKNAAKSTIFLVCRKRSEGRDSPFFEEIEGKVRTAAREALERFSEAGLDGVDLLLSTYGPALSVLSEHWPVYSSEPGPDGFARKLRPEEALDVARAEVVRIQKQQLIGRDIEFDPITDWYLIAWQTFGAVEFPFDDARRLGLATGGIDIDDLKKAKVLAKKSSTVVLEEPAKRYRRETDADLPGVNRDRFRFPVLLDAAHTAMYIADEDGTAAAKAWLDQRNLTSDSRFVALLQGLVNAIPRTKIKGEFVRPEAALLDRLVTGYFPDIELPPEPDAGQGQEVLFDV
ncbi:MAG: DUF1156 domain-containing protein [Acidimicrobiia bacterium]|nr:DUF1156 domain-containing protein [Acidimicrobiia bacterium]